MPADGMCWFAALHASRSSDAYLAVPRHQDSGYAIDHATVRQEAHAAKDIADPLLKYYRSQADERATLISKGSFFVEDSDMSTCSMLYGITIRVTVDPSIAKWYTAEHRDKWWPSPT